MAKTRLAPLKRITIVRLEMNAALLAIKRMKVFIGRESRLEFQKCYFIVDSEIVRAMIQKESYGLKTFTGVRIGEIQETTDPRDWYWIDGHENIADVLTRGKRSSAISQDSIWHTAPSFLQQHEQEWPIKSSYCGENLPEQIIVHHQQAEVKKPRKISDVIDANHFSRYRKLINVTARLSVTFKTRSFTAIFKQPGIDDVKAAEVLWIKDAQQSIQQEFQNGAFKRLCAKEVDRIIVVGARLESWLENNYSNQNPALLPFNHPLSRLYAEYEHYRSHQGVTSISSKVRQNVWIKQLPKMLKSIKHHCATCKILDKKTEGQIMGCIPADRLKPAPAWSYTSIDIFGPFQIKGETNKRSRSKCYGIIFNCMLTRAVHLDLAVDYSTDAFLLVLRRFMTIRGHPIKLRSDHGSQLVAASKELKQILDGHNTERLIQLSSEYSFEWEFSSPDAPWQNGCAEALIKSVKKSISVSIEARGLFFLRDVSSVLRISKLIE